MPNGIPRTNTHVHIPPDLSSDRTLGELLTLVAAGETSYVRAYGSLAAHLIDETSRNARAPLGR